ncbi:MAG: Kelch repeat-containing protein [Candidatus Bathyarchaeia archaeon]
MASVYKVSWFEANKVLRMQTPKATLHLIIVLFALTCAFSTVQGSLPLDLPLPSQTNPPPDSWSTAAPMPTNRWQFGVTVVNQKIYAVGGMADSPSGPVRLNTTEEFDPATNTWTTKQPMPFPTVPLSRFSFGVTSVGGKVYAFGVDNYSEPVAVEVLVYDPVVDQWENKVALPLDASAETIVIANAVGDKIYVMGNSDSGLFNQEYDPATQTWATKATPQISPVGCSSCVSDGKIYLLGEALNPEADTTSLQVYNPQTDTWSSLAPLSSLMSLSSGSAAATSGVNALRRLYFFGTFNGSTGAGFMYDPATDSWSAISSLSERLEFFRVANVNDQLFAIGGFLSPVISGYPDHTFVYTPFGYGNSQTSTPEPFFEIPSLLPVVAIAVAVVFVVGFVLVVVMKRKR